jgi:methionine synthase II (cobalamin-independent)
MTTATGVGSMPGDDQLGYEEAVRLVLEELPDLPHVPELPGRGVTAGMIGRGLAVMAALGADLQPAGWRLTDAPGVDHRRARSLLGQDLDVLEEHSQGYTGAFKVQVAGPWTLAATVEKPRGDKAVSDSGARRDLAQALAEGLRDHVRDVRHRLPGVDRLVVQIDEPMLASVLEARVPTASGLGRHRSVYPEEVSDSLRWVLDAITEAGAEPWVHACAPHAPLQLLRDAGARGISVDLDQMGAVDHDVLAEALEAGETVVLGVVPSTDPDPRPSDGDVTERVLRWLDMLGLDHAQVSPTLVISATCGLAGASAAWSRSAVSLTRAAAAHLS